jgi:hypothetical protein
MVSGMLAMGLAFGLALSGCASFNNLFNPIHAINTSGEKVAAVLGSGRTVKINDVAYQYAERPTVPAAPQKPAEPRKPNPPKWSVDTIDVTTGTRHTIESYSSTEQGGILLTPGEFLLKAGPSGIPNTQVNLSRMDDTILWFTSILTESEGTPVEKEDGCRVYRADRTTEGVFLTVTREGGLVNTVGFSLREIPAVLAEIQQIREAGTA